MEYTVTAWEKEYFLVTPDDLETVLEGFHHVAVVGVKRGYTESDPADFHASYRTLYDRLAAGDKLLWARDWGFAGLHTGLTDHTENVAYAPTKRLSVPDFAEPCVELQAFAVRAWKDSPLTKGWEISQNPENILGLVMCFPSKVLYPGGGIRTSDTLADVTVRDTIRSRLKTFTKPLKVTNGEKTVNTRIRVSEAAKADLRQFFFMKDSGLTIL